MISKTCRIAAGKALSYPHLSVCPNALSPSPYHLVYWHDLSQTGLPLKAELYLSTLHLQLLAQGLIHSHSKCSKTAELINEAKGIQPSSLRVQIGQLRPRYQKNVGQDPKSAGSLPLADEGLQPFPLIS